LGFRSVLPCLVLLAGCVLKPKDIPGNVFVTDEKGQARKLALVPVSIYTEAEMQKAVEGARKRHLDRVEKAKEKEKNLAKDVAFLEGEARKLAIKKNSLEEKISELEKTKEQFKENQDTYDLKTYNIMAKKLSEEYDSATKDRENTGKTLWEFVQKLELVRAEQKALRLYAGISWEGDSIGLPLEEIDRAKATDPYKHLPSRSLMTATWASSIFEDVFSHLPPPAVETRTDADGNFLIPSPPRGRLAISARFYRTKGDKPESLYWLLYLPQPLPPDGRVLLNNENLLSASPTNAVFRLQGR